MKRGKMVKNICIFEDEGFKNLLPLCYLRPVFELRCGISSLKEKIAGFYPEAKLHLLCRDYLVDVTKRRSKETSVNDLKIEGNCLFINGRILAGKDLSRRIPLDGAEEIALSEEVLIYARLTPKTIAEVFREDGHLRNTTIELLKKKVKVTKIKLDLISYPWHLINYNSEAIKDDYQSIGGGKVEGFLDKAATVYGDRSQLFIGESSRVEAGVVLNLTEGPIYIGKNVKVRPFTIIDGPSFVGDESIIDGAKLREGSSIGRVCRVGGEVEESIIHAYSNKHHDGFLGHAYVGEWVNIGAMATNSDLKNNYGKIKVYINNELVNSGEIKLGCFIADHTKLGIGTLINTGTVIGVCSNIFGSGIPPKNIPSFVWGGASGFIEYGLEKALENSKTIMGRRKIVQSEEDRELLREIFARTKNDRELLK